MSRIVLLVPGAMGVVCAAYTGIYLVRWEWNRAIISGIFLIASELIVAGGLILRRIRRSEERILAVVAERSPGAREVGTTDAAAAALDALRASAPEPPDRFSWIRDRSGQMNVFLPVLLGAGVVASALAWAVEHLARATVSPTLERRLARRLGALALPAGGLLSATPPAPARTRRSWPVRTGIAVMVVAVGVLTAAGLDFVADRTQTRPDVPRPHVQTLVELELFGAVAESDPDRIIQHLWSVCTGPDVFRLRALPPPVVEHDVDGVTRVLLDADVGSHGADRLRGCLNDTTLDKVQARVVGLSVR